MTESIKLKPLSAALLSLIASAAVDVLRTVQALSENQAIDAEAALGLAVCAHMDRLAIVLDALYLVQPATRSADLPIADLITRAGQVLKAAAAAYGSDLASLQQIGTLTDQIRDIKAA